MGRAFLVNMLRILVYNAEMELCGRVLRSLPGISLKSRCVKSNMALLQSTFIRFLYFIFIILY